MKKLLMLVAVLFALAAMTACKNGRATDAVNNTTCEITWSSIEDKLHNEISLNERDCLFVLSDTTLDDGSSEGVGNYLFRYLCGYRKSNKLFIDARKNFTREEGDEKLRRLMELMWIDIALAEYEDYEEFLDDFPMFRGCAGAEELFEDINDGQ